MIMEKAFFSFPLLLLFLLHCTTTLAQPAAAPAAPTPPGPTASPPAPPLPTSAPPAPLVTAAAPGPSSGPTNVTKILEKAKQFSLFIRLLKSTSVADQIEKQLNDSNIGMTIFAPTDSAISGLTSGVLNSLSDQQKESLMQFHVIAQYIPLSQFQTVSNPLRTNAGDSSRYKYPLNVTAYPNSVNISTGITNASLSGTIYSDGQLAIYQVEKVLLPWDIFGAKPPAPAPAPGKRKKENNDDDDDDDDAVADSSNDAKMNTSGATRLVIMARQSRVFSGLAMVAAIIFYL